MEPSWDENIPSGTSPWKFLLFITRQYRVFAIFSILCVVLAVVMDTATAYLFKVITNSAHALTNGAGVAPLWYATGAYVIVSLLSTLFSRGSGFIGMYWSTGARASTRYALSAYVIRHSTTYFSDRFAGSISSKLTQASSSMMSIIEGILWQFIPFVVSIVGSFILAFYTSPIIACIFLAWVSIVTPINVYLVKKGVPLAIATQKSETALGGATVDLLTNIHTVHEYAHHSFELEHLKRLVLNRRVSGLTRWIFNERVRLANGMLQALFVGSMIAIATLLASHGVISAGDVVLTLTLILMIADRLTFIGSQLNNFGDAWGQVEESLSDIVRPYDISEKDDAKALEQARGIIFFDDVSFSYGGNNVLNHLSLQIPAGQRLGLVGRSGAGKSTFIKILLRHYDVTSGSVKISGENITEVTRDSLRRMIALVPQEPLLFHRSIRENIAYGKPTATEEEIVHAAKLAEAHTFIDQLPEKYDSLVGERGVKLSGGQRQRIVIARAILKNAPILLLDEATSSLDSESEVAVQKAFLALMENRTVIAIAHRLSTLRAMDRIIVMDEGRIVEDGTHDELLAQNGTYATLWNHQAGGFIEANE